ncbi:MAG: AbrB/MazE/SpoVT family DNA-binding domain-containing protein [Deltaproteobacteria bacterium]|nr:AbrB/MazE/SpoVT family DNA-binding domain-containing protein [Deltaproteobacteria bacterium]
MRSTTVSSKGQVVIPREVRDRHGWPPGTVLEIEEQQNAIVLRPVAALVRTKLDDLIGCTGYVGPTKTIEDMEEAIATAARRSR